MKSLRTLLPPALLLSMLVPAYAQVTFDFIDNSDPDDPENTNPPDETEALDGGDGGGGLGAFVTLNDGEIPVTLTTIDIIGQDGSSALVDGSGHTTNIAGNQNAIAVNTANDIDNDFISGGSDSTHFNPSEAWVFSFDVDVNLTNIETESLTPDQQTFTVSSGDTTVTLVDNMNPLTDFFIEANTEIRIEFVELVEGGTDTQIRVESITVEALSAPEPTEELEIVASGFDGANFFIEVEESIDVLIVTSSDTLDFDSASEVNATVDTANNRFLIPESERNVVSDFFRVERP